MGAPRLQRHEPDILEDEAGEGRVLECHVGVVSAGSADGFCMVDMILLF